METDSNKLLEWIDEVIELSKPIFEADSACALYFVLQDKFTISTSEVDELEKEIAKRDHNMAMISTFQNKIHSIVLTMPWQIINNECVLPTKTNEELICAINDLQPNSN